MFVKKNNVIILQYERIKLVTKISNKDLSILLIAYDKVVKLFTFNYSAVLYRIVDNYYKNIKSRSISKYEVRK